ncbi:DUF1178 family protein [Paenirhodobacter enshiensis]|uniref:DUF1178 family protein n=1 Tax=Paenirhodobacter enshiensis TaxID=1105367 RepID=UPI0035B17692
MIRYTLKCDHDHAFESWFASAEAFDKLSAAGMVACTVCGSAKVAKTLMAPAVRPARKAVAAEAPHPETAQAAPATAPDPAGIIAALRRAVEQNSDYVGKDFATEARAMHEGEAPERAIWGEARPDEARALIEDGIEVTPLPFMSPRKTN